VLEDGSADYTPGVSRTQSSTTTFAHAGLKNTSAQSAENETVAASRVYDAFGNTVSSSGSWSGPFGYAGSFGYQEDASNLKLLGHRYYDPTIGRFITQDPIGDGRNWYAYCAGRTLDEVDPDGLQSLPARMLGGLLTDAKAQEIIVTIVHGDLSGGLVWYEDNIEDHWMTYIKSRHKGMRVKRIHVDHPSVARFNQALDESDIVVFIGHGATGTLQLSPTVGYGGSDALEYAMKRKGKRHLDWLILATCEGMSGETYWGYTSKWAWGVPGVCSYRGLSNGTGGSWHNYPNDPKFPGVSTASVERP
jgi:RHS repeat-associated protein